MSPRRLKTVTLLFHELLDSLVQLLTGFHVAGLHGVHDAVVDVVLQDHFADARTFPGKEFPDSLIALRLAGYPLILKSNRIRYFGKIRESDSALRIDSNKRRMHQIALCLPHGMVSMIVQQE